MKGKFYTMVAVGSIAFALMSSKGAIAEGFKIDASNAEDIIDVSPKWVDLNKEMKRINVRRAIAEMNDNPYYINMIAENDSQITGIAN